jgi:hypothetical protein
MQGACFAQRPRPHAIKYFRAISLLFPTSSPLKSRMYFAGEKVTIDQKIRLWVHGLLLNS